MGIQRKIFLSFCAFIFCEVVEGSIGRHVFVSESKNWTDAQAYCRKEYTDLFFVNSQSDNEKIKNAAGQVEQRWIGLQQDPDSKMWKWSGGGNITYTNWGYNQPEDYRLRKHNGAVWYDGTWNDKRGDNTLHFYCIKITVMKEKKSWEEALEHCREHKTDLPSTVSETDTLLAQAEIKKAQTIERVWIGLRFLGDQWLWVNGDPLVFEAWPQDGDQGHQCPVWTRCGALTKMGRWEKWDCTDKLNFICV